MRKKLIALALSATALVASPAIAQSVPVSGNVTVTAGGSDPGLKVQTSELPSNPDFSTVLTLGGPDQTANLFYISTNEASVELDDIINPHPISVAFTFIDPTGASGSPITGFTSGFYSFYGSCSALGFTGGGNGGCGQVQWSGPVTFNYGSGGAFSVMLNDAIFPTTANVQTAVTGTFHLISASVPEPASWAMMLLGFGGMGMIMRRSRRNSGHLALAQIA